MERKHPLAQCENCPLATGSKFVPSEVPERPRLAVVGEAPGYYETSYGRPFVGPSGKLLDQVLGHYGYPRSEVMYTNVTLCRPEGNATPPKAAANACRPRLLGELRLAGVSDIVALGGTAAAALVDGGGAITGLRVGPPKQASRELRNGGDGSPTRVVPTWHPAYCLRNSDAFPALVSDIGKLKDTGAKTWRAPDWKYFEDPAIARQVLAELQSVATHVVVDIEAGIEKDVSFDHPNEFGLLAVGLGYARGKVVVLGESALEDREVLQGLQQLLRNVKIIAHNGKFDLGGLYPHIGGQELWFDTMLASYAVDERPGNHGLKVLAIEKLGAPQWDLEIKKFVPKGGSYANVPRAILYKYNAYDVACTWDLYEYFLDKLDQPVTDWPYTDRPAKTLRDVHDFMVAASDQLMYLELNGITIDRSWQRQLAMQFVERLGGIESQLEEIIGYTLNPRSPKQIKEYLSSQEINVESTNQATLEHLQETLAKHDSFGPEHEVLEFIATLLGHRRQQKLYSTYVEGIRKRMYRGRVYTTYTLHGTTSGRLASRNPNLQNIVRDKDIRRQFTVAKPENVFVHADFKQAEGRVICYFAEDEYLRGIFCDPNVDIFDELSDQLYGKGNWRKDVERIRTKAFFYGLGYGREEYSIAMEFGMSVSEASRRMQEFMSLIPATVAWQKATRDDVLAGKDLVSPFGRRRRFWLITEQNQKDVLNEALSFLPQSTASDICLDAFTRVRPRLRGLGFVRLTIHDALVAECHEDRKDEVANILTEEMVAAGRRFTDYVPFEVDTSYGKSWGDI